MGLATPRRYSRSLLNRFLDQGGQDTDDSQAQVLHAGGHSSGGILGGGRGGRVAGGAGGAGTGGSGRAGAGAGLRGRLLGWRLLAALVADVGRAGLLLRRVADVCEVALVGGLLADVLQKQGSCQYWGPAVAVGTRPKYAMTYVRHSVLVIGQVGLGATGTLAVVVESSLDRKFISKSRRRP